MNKIRKSVIAGTWYPGTRSELFDLIKQYFNNVPDQNFTAEPFGLISPHAGYSYSGQTAAYGYSLLKDKNFDLIIIISPFHSMTFNSYLTTKADFFETPLGRVKVEQELLHELSEKIDLKFLSADEEHSIEIQLPFLQYIFDEFSLLPIMVGHRDVYRIDKISEYIFSIIQDKKALIIASSDMHHIDNYEQVKLRDEKAINTLKTFNVEKIRNFLSSPDCSICGNVPISILFELSKKFNAIQSKILNYTNSGDVTGIKSTGHYTVGYLSAVIYPG